MSNDLLPVSDSNTPASFPAGGFPVPMPTQPNDKVEFAISPTGKYATVKADTAAENSTVVIPKKKDGTPGSAYKITKQKK